MIRKAQLYCEYARAVSARNSTGEYWTFGEEQSLAEFLVQHRGQKIDFNDLAAHIPTRTKLALKRRLSGLHSNRLKVLVLEISKGMDAQEDEEQSASEFEDWLEDESLGDE